MRSLGLGGLLAGLSGGRRAPAGRAKRPRCILHIGMNKTGSSSIQATGRDFAERLRDDHGIEYYTGLKSHSLIAGLFMDDPLDYAAIVRQVGPEADRVARWVAAETDRLERVIAEGTAPRFLISGEGLSTMAAAEVGRLQAFLAARFETTDVYVYLRDPVSYAMSKAQQNVKSGVTFAEMRQANLIDPVPGPRLDKGRFSPAIQPFYRHRIAAFRTAFGARHVHLRAFEPAAFPGGDVTADFFVWAADLDLRGTAITARRVNEALDARAVEILEAANRRVPLYLDGRPNPGRAVSLVRAVTANDGEPFVFPDFDFARFAEVVADDVAWLRDATGGAIDFGAGRTRTPVAPGRVPPPPTDLALALNAQLLAAEQGRNREKVLQFLLDAHLAPQDDRAAIRTALADALARCRDRRFLFRILPRLDAIDPGGGLAARARGRAADLDHQPRPSPVPGSAPKGGAGSGGDPL